MARRAWQVIIAFFLITWIIRGFLAAVYLVAFFQAAPSMQLNVHWPFAMSTTIVYGTMIWTRGIAGMAGAWGLTWFATMATAAIHLTILRMIRDESFQFDRLALNLTPWMITLGIAVLMGELLCRRLAEKRDPDLDKTAPE